MPGPFPVSAQSKGRGALPGPGMRPTPADVATDAASTAAGSGAITAQGFTPDSHTARWPYPRGPRCGTRPVGRQPRRRIRLTGERRHGPDPSARTPVRPWTVPVDARGDPTVIPPAATVAPGGESFRLMSSGADVTEVIRPTGRRACPVWIRSSRPARPGPLPRRRSHRALGPPAPRPLARTRRSAFRPRAESATRCRSCRARSASAPLAQA